MMGQRSRPSSCRRRARGSIALSYGSGWDPTLEKVTCRCGYIYNTSERNEWYRFLEIELERGPSAYFIGFETWSIIYYCESMNNQYPQYGQPMNPGYNPNMQPNPYNNPNPMQPMPPIYEASPANIYIDNSSNDLGCPFCGCKTQTVLMRKPGGVTYVWCCVLFWLTGFLCCIPFCVDSCLDAHLMCVRCNNAKQVMPANCC